MKKNFVFLLGTQKAGTTYIYKLLADHPQVCTGGIKEMGYWINFFKDEEQKKDYIKKFEPSKSKKFKIRVENLKDKTFSTYFSRYSISKESKIIKCAADLTPGNALISEQQLLVAYKAIIDNGYKLKPIFLMREPIERLWSQTKMIYFNRILKRKPTELKDINKKRLFNLFLKISERDFERFGRTRYDLNLPKIEKVFNQENVFYYFSENMRENIFKTELFNFLEIDYLLPKKKLIGNPSDISISSNEIPKKYLEEVYDRFKPVYLYVYNKFKEKLPNIWISRINEF